MDSKLNQLFDYQKFQQNPQLAKIISIVEDHYSGVLSDDDLMLVNAAGEYAVPAPKSETPMITIDVDLLHPIEDQAP